MINVGMVGFGLSGRYIQGPFFKRHRKFNLSKIVTSRIIPEEIFGGVIREDSIDALLRDEHIHLISLCSPNSTHYEYAKRALEAGKHVLIEKPITARLEQAEELFELAKSKDLVLYVYQNRRFDSDFLTVKKIIESGVLGEILSFEANYNRYKPVLNAKPWKEAPTEGTGLLYDLGAHLIDQAIDLFGSPDTVEGEAFIQRDGSQVDDAFNLFLKFGAVRVTLRSSLMVKDNGPRYIIHGTKGSFTKSGIDVQEDHSIAGLLPDHPDFGYEPEENDGYLITSIDGLEFVGTVKTYKGNWWGLFDNLAQVINKEAEMTIKPQQILEQMKVYEKIKYSD